MPGASPRRLRVPHSPANPRSAQLGSETRRIRRCVKGYGQFEGAGRANLVSSSAPTRRRSWARPLDLIGGATDPDRSLMTRIIRSVGFVLALASVGLGGGALAWIGQQSGGCAVGHVHAPAPRMGTVCPGRPRRTGHSGQHRRSGRVAGSRGRLDQQHGGLQPLQLAADDRCHRSPDSRGGHFQQLPGLLHLGRRMFGDGGDALPTEHVGDHGRAQGRERHSSVRFSRRGRPKCLVRGVPGWSAVLRQRGVERGRELAGVAARLVGAQRLRQRDIGPVGLSTVDRDGLD